MVGNPHHAAPLNAWISSAAAISIGRQNEFMSIARLECRVSGVRHHSEIRLRPRAVQIPGAGRWTHDVVAALHDGCRYMPYARYVVDQLALAAQETAIHEVVAFDTRDRQGE